MKLKALIFLAGTLITGLIIPVSVKAQNEIEGEMKYSGFFDSYYRRGPLRVTAGAGLSLYRGDLCEDFDCNKQNLNFNAGINYQMFPRVVLGAEVNYLKLGANDIHKERNLTFQADVTEVMLFGRLRLIEDIMRQPVDRTDDPKPFKPFLLSGFGMAFYNSNSQYAEVPEGKKQFRTIDETLLTLAIPAGVGFSVRINPQFAVIAQGAYRFTPTDQLDDVPSEISNNNKNDGYATAGLKIRFTPGAPAKDNAAFSPPSSSGGSSGSSSGSGSNDSGGDSNNKSKESSEPDTGGGDSTGGKEKESSEDKEKDSTPAKPEQNKEEENTLPNQFDDSNDNQDNQEEDDSGGGGGWGDDSGGDSGDDSGGGGGW